MICGETSGSAESNDVDDWDRIDATPRRVEVEALDNVFLSH